MYFFFSDIQFIQKLFTDYHINYEINVSFSNFLNCSIFQYTNRICVGCWHIYS